jgi:uncharacterized protein (TIGR00369 family)
MPIGQLQQLFDAVPYHAGLPLRFEELDPAGETLTATLEGRPGLSRLPGGQELHGGAAAAVLDAASCFLLVALSQRPVATVDLRLDFLAAGREAPYRVRAAVRRRGRTSVVDAQIADADQQVVTLARGIYRIVDA